MSLVTIEETDDERSIVTPGLRLRFNWIGDRWTHAIDLGPGPEPDDAWPWSINPRRGQWLVLAEAVEWAPAKGDLANVRNPVFQELHFQDDPKGATALLVGQAGPHHFSASFRVEDDAMQMADRTEIRDGLDGYHPRVLVDIADRCSVPVNSLGSTYLIHNPIDSYFLGDVPDDSGSLTEPFTMFESGIWSNARHDYSFGDKTRNRSAHRLVIAQSEGGKHQGGWLVNYLATIDPQIRTQRYRYSWLHDCSTSTYLRVLRERDPAYDAQLRTDEAEREVGRVANLEACQRPEFVAWLKRMSKPPDFFNDTC